MQHTVHNHATIRVADRMGVSGRVTADSNKASLQRMPTGTGLLLAFTVSLVTSGFVLSANGNARKTAIITFDAPGATHGYMQGTHGNAISPQGTIAGTFDLNGNHGFVRARDGTFITFDVPGAGTGPFHGTYALSINPAETITGPYVDASGLAHGYVRASDGTFTTFDAPGAGTNGALGQGTFPVDINPAGAIAGYYLDASNVFHGFVRAPNGAITTFDAPGAGTGQFHSTSPASVDGLNPAGAIAGYYSDASNVFHGYVRAPNGGITTFDVPGAGTGPGQGTQLSGINPAGTVTGVFTDASNVFHGFVRAPNGAITTFDAPGAGTGQFQGTIGEAINPVGTIPGNYIDASSANHGFVRDKHGGLTTFDAPGAGTGSGQGTIPAVNNPAGAIVGEYIDQNNAYHGFLLEGE